MFKTSMLVSDLIRFGCLAQTGEDTVEVDLVGHVGVCVDVGMCVSGGSQYVGSQSTRVFEMGKYLVFVVQIESEALVQSELNFLGRQSPTPSLTATPHLTLPTFTACSRHHVSTRAFACRICLLHGIPGQASRR
jgi:hypothetical protein